MIKHYQEEWIQEWCQANGWTDLIIAGPHSYWAFPPGAVIPEPLPVGVLERIKMEKGLSPQEQVLSLVLWGVTIALSLSSFWLRTPIPLVLAFSLGAIGCAHLEID